MPNRFIKTIKSPYFLIATLCITVLIFLMYNLRNATYFNDQSQDKIKSKVAQDNRNSENNNCLSNLTYFEFVMNNETLCKTSGTVNQSSILIMVHTARLNFDHRYAIRNTWGSLKIYKDWQLHLIFLLGIDFVNDREDEVRLQKESDEHGDIIMGNFEDSYRNLTYKHLMGYKWISQFCPTANFILKIDDDMFADIFQVVDLLPQQLHSSNKAYACLNMKGSRPIRVATSKWYVSKKLYAEDKYPEYCSGSAYLMKAEAASKIYSISNKKKFFWIDDVFVTGILREKYNALINQTKNGNLEVLSLIKRHHLNNKNEIIAWCSQGLGTGQLSYIFILLNKSEFVQNMFCIWNKLKLLNHAMDSVGKSDTYKIL